MSEQKSSLPSTLITLGVLFGIVYFFYASTVIDNETFTVTKADEFSRCYVPGFGNRKITVDVKPVTEKSVAVGLVPEKEVELASVRPDENVDLEKSSVKGTYFYNVRQGINFSTTTTGGAAEPLCLIIRNTSYKDKVKVKVNFKTEFRL